MAANNKKHRKLIERTLLGDVTESSVSPPFGSAGFIP